MKIDEFLNNMTMYRLVVYVLGFYAGLGVFFALFGKLSLSPTGMIVSLALLLSSAYISDKGFARLFRVPSNAESWLITALILFLIVQPANSIMTGVALVLAGAVSSASKYLLSWNDRHIFNPAAFAAALLSLTSLQATTWWIGSSVFWPVTLVLGLAIVRKIRHTTLFLTFVLTSIALQFIVFVAHNQPLGVGMKGALIASPLIFLASIMLTEPATMPPRRNQQIIFGVAIAALYVTAWKVGPLYVYPEVALLLGNIYAFAVSPKFRARLYLKDIQQISDQVYNYVFQPNRPFDFLPGQYMEWTLAGVPYDSRGNRRTFTIASSPTEQDIQIGLKYYPQPSAFKSTFAQLQLGDSIYASQLAGNFTIDPGADEKLAFIAGGIGITPFRSMVKYLLDKNLQKDVILLYVISSAEELAYHDDFLEARRVGLGYIPIVTDARQDVSGTLNAKLSQELLLQVFPDFSERRFYISGPNHMVDSTKRYLRNLGVKNAKIKTDHFSGY